MSTKGGCSVDQAKKQSLKTQELLKNQSPRLVPPFSIQSLQKNTKVMPYSVFNRNRKLTKKPRRTSFRMHYERGDLPLRLEYFSGGARILWTMDLNKLNYHLYLPLFFDGLSESEHPYKTYAQQGVRDLINFGRDKIYNCIPQLIVPIKRALNTNNKEVMCVTLKIIQQMVMASDLVGPGLVPFYRQLLPMFNAYKTFEATCDDKVDYSQKKSCNLSVLVEETLQVLERHGGEDAFINIKYMCPTYESCLLN
ncbi:parkin coregulated gene protein homolog [Contarinia nasturtii]|uniref:parkin coregulated gene protein homolog n=1 Tax=Contarinia nasturtii TaxID=265458 RepID=UPI0012D417E7|nr:parkin coregulated gene protein homolog [Contarinia nasturtii]